MNPASSMANNVQGALWASLAACLLGVLSLLVRKIAGALHPFEIAFFRNLGQLLLMVPWILYAGVSVLKTDRPWAHVRRSFFGILAMLSWFWVITQMPLAEATAISFSAPLFTTFGAAIFLGEKVGMRRWTATAIGFVGVLLIIRPGFQGVDTPRLVALMTAASHTQAFTDGNCQYPMAGGRENRLMNTPIHTTIALGCSVRVKDLLASIAAAIKAAVIRATRRGVSTP